MYSVTITGRAEKELRRLDRSVKNRIVKVILALGSDPRPPRLPQSAKRRRCMANPRWRLAHWLSA